MLRITASDAESLAALAGTVQTQHDELVAMIQALHRVRAHLSGVQHMVHAILDRAEARRAPPQEA